MGISMTLSQPLTLPLLHHFESIGTDVIGHPCGMLPLFLAVLWLPILVQLTAMSMPEAALKLKYSTATWIKAIYWDLLLANLLLPSVKLVLYLQLWIAGHQPSHPFPGHVTIPL